MHNLVEAVLRLRDVARRADVEETSMRLSITFRGYSDRERFKAELKRQTRPEDYGYGLNGYSYNDRFDLDEMRIAGVEVRIV